MRAKGTARVQASSNENDDAPRSNINASARRQNEGHESATVSGRRCPEPDLINDDDDALLRRRPAHGHRNGGQSDCGDRRGTTTGPFGARFSVYLRFNSGW